MISKIYFTNLNNIPQLSPKMVLEYNPQQQKRNFYMKFKTTFALAIAATFALAAQAQNQKPAVTILATGGTIAGVAKSNTDTVNYKAGSLGIDTLLKAVPEINDFAQISGEQVANVPSPDIGNDTLIKLSNTIKQKLASGADGIVVTHGTDTLEETAFFLDLTVNSPKPVVLVGAMRPATALSADGTLNLLQAVSLASNKDSANRGTLIAFNDRIGSAYYTTKTNSTTVDTFKAQEQGYLGQFSGVNPKFYYSAATVTGKHIFDVTKLTQLPQVSVVYLHTEADLPMFEAAVKNGAKGIVVAGTGNGSLPNSLKARVKELMDSGIPVVRSTRTGNGYVGKSTIMGGIGAGFLNPQKARILLSLSLTTTQNVSEIEKIFGTN